TWRVGQLARRWREWLNLWTRHALQGRVASTSFRSGGLAGRVRSSTEPQMAYRTACGSVPCVDCTESESSSTRFHRDKITEELFKEEQARIASELERATIEVLLPG